MPRVARSMRRSWRKIHRGRAGAEKSNALKHWAGIRTKKWQGSRLATSIRSTTSALGLFPEAANHGDSSLNSDLSAHTSFFVFSMKATLRNFAPFVTHFLQDSAAFA